MNWKRLGKEFAFIGRIVEKVDTDSISGVRIPAHLNAQRPTPNTLRLIQGIGDDTAVVETGGGWLLWTTDMLVENVHFRLDLCDPYRLGWKSLAVNLSDVAAMGGEPALALFSCGQPPERLNEWAEALIEGLLDCAKQYGTVLAGGDTNRASLVVLNVDVMGTCAHPPVLRSTAQPGDRLLVTGQLGGSRAGLERLLLGGLVAAEAADPSAVETHLKPQPRLREGALAAQHSASAMMDLSDGLAGDALKLCESSGCGAVLIKEALPLHPAVIRLADERGLDAYELALVGGEDYELLMAVRPERVKRLQEVITSETGVPVTEIGVLTKESAIFVEDENGNHKPLPSGWDHFGA